MPKIRKIEPTVPAIKPLKKVAAYARVSMQSERMMHSLSAQISYYSKIIQKNPDWEYAGVYADDFISGTNTVKRDEFKRMLADCEEGKIDIILTKSISRFARNTVDLLETVRDLKSKGIEVRFEKENINSMSGDGELMLSILASFAQEESRSISENVRWATKKRFEKGIPNGRFKIFGYRWEGDKLVVVPEEAKIVQLIFENFQKGLSAESTEKQLEKMGVKSFKGQHFGNTSIRQILGNITYTGNLLFQKEYTVDPISKKTRKNKGELPQYYVENTHEAIIPLETYEAVQAEIARRRELGVFANWSISTTCFTSKIKCGNCGVSYRRSGKRQRKNADEVYYVWVCQTYDRKGKKACSAKTIPERTLKNICAEVLGLSDFDESIFSEQIDKIVVIGDDQLDFYFTDGHVVHQKWQSKARTECWSEERRKEWGELHKGKNPRKKDQNPFTGYIHCPACGSNFRRQSRTYVDGVKFTYWHCPNCTKCGNKSKPPEDILKQLIAEVTGKSTFNETAFHKKVRAIYLTGTYEATFRMVDGTEIIKTWEPIKKRGHKHTEEYKEYMSRVMKEKWTDEHREKMSERMKQLRKERGENWRTEK